MTDKTKRHEQAAQNTKQRGEKAGAESLQGRRRILKSLAIGGGVAATNKVMPTEWKKPLVQTVIVPGHAQGSSPIGSLFRTSNDVNLITSVDPAGPSSFDPLEMLVPNAQANYINNDCSGVNVSGTFSATYDLTFAFNPNNSVDICIEVASPTITGAGQTSSTLNNDGSLSDVNFESGAVLLTNMSFDPGNFAVNGTIDFNDSDLNCPPDAFLAPVFAGPFLCPLNVTSTMDWSDPYGEKPKLA